jgi:superfamily II DNA helicase RecQ
MNKVGLNAIGIDSHAEEEDPKLWEKVDNSEYDIVYITPEMALNPVGHYFKNSHLNH